MAAPCLPSAKTRLRPKSVGIVIMRPRLMAFVISAFFTAVAGALWAHFLTSFSPKAFYFDITFRVITMLVVGGMGSVTGSVVGPIADDGHRRSPAPF